MNLFVKKIPRGRISHTVGESISYLFRAVLSPLDRQESVRAFEGAFAAYSGSKNCVAFPFARTAIFFILKGLHLPKGTQVILPPITIKGIVDAVLDLGLVPLYVDLDAETINFRVDALREAITPNVKAAILTPLFGLVPDVPAIMKLLRDSGIFVIEDFSQCLNGRYDGKRVGTFGNAGVYSASSIKTLDTLGGGMAVTDDLCIHESLLKAQASLARPSRKLLVQKAWVNLVRNIATCQPVFSVLTFPLLQLVRRVRPGLALKQTGNRNKSRLPTLPQMWFCRYTSVQAEIGLAHIGKIAACDARRVENAEVIKAHCVTSDFPKTTPQSHNVYWQLLLLVPDAIRTQAWLSNFGIDSATSSLELVCELQGYPGRVVLPTAERIYRNGILVPCFPHLFKSDLKRIIDALKGLALELRDGG
jgi:perosamine synthetase